MTPIKYNCYLDLLGIKELAKYSSEKYFAAIDKFSKTIFKASHTFTQNGNSQNSKVYFFSDCAFLESDSLKSILDYLMSLRYELTKNSPAYFYIAAVSTHSLEAFTITGEQLTSYNQNNVQLSEEYKTLLEGHESFLVGTVFNSRNISKVYILQNNFKGIGIYIDSDAIKSWEIFLKATKPKTFENEKKAFHNKYISDSFYFPIANSNIAYRFYDIKLTKEERSESNFNEIISRYHNANTKNSKYGRYYLSILINWIQNTDISQTMSVNWVTKEEKKQGKKTTIIDLPDIFQWLLNTDDSLIADLNHNAHYFEFLYFFILKKVYEIYRNYDAIIIYFILDLNRRPNCKKHFKELDEIPKEVFNAEDKDRFIGDYSKVLKFIVLEREKDKQNKIEKQKRLQQKKIKKNSIAEIIQNIKKNKIEILSLNDKIKTEKNDESIIDLLIQKKQQFEVKIDDDITSIDKLKNEIEILQNEINNL